ncbi:hypothetical protein Ahy_B02g061111 [Arachis hypogaea]|uniref:Peptidase A2 domain-containing protein n=1 Tax=Arachis hypogaea TaxID=3818 RepID=A0A445AKA8_ARAHY|nr:hypothetical protein Ahy_B02g061111 [Arachis hypogaea]
MVKRFFHSSVMKINQGIFLRPSEKKSHLRPLHITATMSGIQVNKVLINSGAAISLLPERMLMKVGKHPNDLVPTNIVVTDFSGTSTPAKGLVTLGYEWDLLIETLFSWWCLRKQVIMPY